VLYGRSDAAAATTVWSSAIDTEDTLGLGCHGLLGSLDEAGLALARA
jgi:hypothetical protein